MLYFSLIGKYHIFYHYYKVTTSYHGAASISPTSSGVLDVLLLSFFIPLSLLSRKGHISITQRWEVSKARLTVSVQLFKGVWEVSVVLAELTPFLSAS